MMKILLLGEYSNVHWTLAEGLRKLGHHVTVASNGDFWKNYRRDISLVRKVDSLTGTLAFLTKVAMALPKMRGYDVVQLINPMFLELKAERIFPIYRYLRRHNKKIFMGAYGMDYYWENICRTNNTYKYSDFNFGNTLRTDEVAMREVRDWTGTEKQRLNEMIANDCNGIAAGLYEYYACYRQVFPEKTQFIPFPINTDEVDYLPLPPIADGKVVFFIGISKGRSAYKGTDIMLRALNRLKERYPEHCIIEKAESVPYEKYCRMIDNSHVLLDQLYSYTPAMNGLLAMAKGKVLVGGGEEENYAVLGEERLHPIVNVEPNEEDVYRKLENLILHPELLPKLSKESREYIEKYHDYTNVAQQYLDFWNGKQANSSNK